MIGNPPGIPRVLVATMLDALEQRYTHSCTHKYSKKRRLYCFYIRIIWYYEIFSMLLCHRFDVLCIRSIYVFAMLSINLFNDRKDSISI